jgi:hypothetical protein
MFAGGSASGCGGRRRWDLTSVGGEGKIAATDFKS